METVELYDTNPQNPGNGNDDDLLARKKTLKKACYKVGLIMIICFLSQVAGSLIIHTLSDNFSAFTPEISYLCQTAVWTVFVYVIPVTACVFITQFHKSLPEIFAKPVSFNRALAMFPSVYGAGITVNLLTVLVMTFINKYTDLNKSFNRFSEIAADNTNTAFVLAFQLVVLAPVFEELLCRGIILNALKEHGKGFAVFVSAFLFGILHGNFQQFFYAAAVGVILGYVAVVTKSVIPGIVLHAMLNSIAAVMFIFISTPVISDYMENPSPAEIMHKSDGDMLILSLFAIYIIIVLILLVFSVISVIKRLINIKKHRFTDEPQPFSLKRRFAVFFACPPVIIMIVICSRMFLS